MTRKHAWGTALYYLVTLLIAFIAMVPFVWMISTSLKTRGALMSIPIEWVPEHPTLDAYQTVFERFPFFQTILNSLFISVSYTVLTLLSASLQCLALLRRKGRDRLRAVALHRRLGHRHRRAGPAAGPARRPAASRAGRGCAAGWTVAAAFPAQPAGGTASARPAKPARSGSAHRPDAHAPAAPAPGCPARAARR